MNPAFIGTHGTNERRKLIVRILFLTARQFWPIDTGGKLRDYHLARQLASRARVTYLGFADPATPDDCPQHLAAAFTSIIMEPRNAGYSAINLARGLVDRLPATVLNYTTPGMQRRLQHVLSSEAFDVIQMEGVHLAGYWPLLKQARGRPRIISDWHNIESELMTRYAANARNPAVRLYARATAQRLERLESMLLHECDAILVASARERQELLHRSPAASVHVVENGVDTAYYANPHARRIVPIAQPSILFVGSMDYHANIDAAIWFANELWPAIKARHPDLTFQIVGRAPPPSVRALTRYPGIIVTGSVPDVRPYYRDALAAVVPLRVGGGTRLKILESMAAGTPVVSTSIGAEGLLATAGNEILIADTAAAFLSAITRLVTDEQLSSDLSRAALRHVVATYDWSVVGARLLAIHQATIDLGRAA